MRFPGPFSGVPCGSGAIVEASRSPSKRGQTSVTRAHNVGADTIQFPGDVVWRFKARRVGLLVASLSMLAAAFSAVLGSDSDQPGLGVSLVTDKPVYAPGEPVQIAFEVANHGAAPVTLRFSSAQRFDMAIADEAGRDVWRWSAGRMFAAVMGQETLGPDNPSLTYEAEFAGELAPGRYTIKALLTDGSRQVSATIGVEVR